LFQKIPNAKQQPMANSFTTTTMIDASTTTVTNTTNLLDQFSPSDALVKRDKLVKTDSTSSSE